MQQEQEKYDLAMTLSSCLWLGLFPLLQGFSYTRITLDKWLIMLVLCGLTLLCFCFDAVRRFRSAAPRGVKPFASFASAPRLPLLLGGLLLALGIAVLLIMRVFMKISQIFLRSAFFPFCFSIRIETSCK